MQTSCLIIVDIQNDFCTGTLAIERSEELIPLINNIMHKFDLVVACRDWHPANHKSFASMHPGKQVGDIIDLAGTEQVLWPDHCVQGSYGAEFHKELHIANFAKVFQKGTNANVDSYSVFYDVRHKNSTGLSEWLKTQGVQTIFIVGLATDYCVKFSALDAIRDNFEVFVIHDFCRAVNLKKDDEQNAITVMQQKGAKIVRNYQAQGTAELY